MIDKVLHNRDEAGICDCRTFPSQHFQSHTRIEKRNCHIGAAQIEYHGHRQYSRDMENRQWRPNPISRFTFVSHTQIPAVCDLRTMRNHRPFGIGGRP